MSVTAQAITHESLGAWVIKCNPSKTDLGPMVAAGRAHEHWCVATNYRTMMMQSGQRVLFWVSGNARQRGIWGAGRLTDTPEPGAQWKIATSIALFARPVLATSLSAVPELANMEVFRSPQQANPSWVSVDEWAALHLLLPA